MSREEAERLLAKLKRAERKFGENPARTKQIQRLEARLNQAKR